MLSSVVLPAPLGPMTDRISPRRTSRLTRITAWTPPKALETSLISSWELIPRNLSRQPPLPAPVVLHVAVALALAHAGEPQVELLDVLVVADGLAVAVEDHAPVLHDVDVLGEAQRHVGVLLGEQHGQLLAAGDVPGVDGAALAEPREIAVHAIEILPHGATVPARVGAGEEVLLHG